MILHFQQKRRIDTLAAKSLQARGRRQKDLWGTMANILVVDDDPVSRNIVTKILEKDEHTVTACASAPAAIEELTFKEFDLLVTDIIMPEHDGFEVIQAARSLRPTLKVIVLSGIDERVPQELSMAAFDRLGVCRVVRKPIKPAVLVSEVLAVLVAG